MTCSPSLVPTLGSWGPSKCRSPQGGTRTQGLPPGGSLPGTHARGRLARELAHGVPLRGDRQEGGGGPACASGRTEKQEEQVAPQGPEHRERGPPPRPQAHPAVAGGPAGDRLPS